MGLIHGVYDAKAEGFLPGGGSLHNCFRARPRPNHVCQGFHRGLKPVYQGNTLAFMFEAGMCLSRVRLRWKAPPFKKL